MLRSRLSRGLALLVHPLGSASVTVGIFVLLNVIGLSLPVSIIAALPIVIFLTYVYMIAIANKERELLAEDKVKDNTIEHREEVSKRSTGIAMTSILAITAISVYLVVNFFGFAPAVNSFAYIAAMFGLLIGLGTVVYTYEPLSNVMYKWFSNIGIQRKPRKHKHNAKVVKKSAEPEEAVFIGIND